MEVDEALICCLTSDGSGLGGLINNVDEALVSRWTSDD